MRVRRGPDGARRRGWRVLADDLVEETEFGFLFNRDRQLFSIGFSVADGRLDRSHYDTLASEARLASFVAIATGAIPHEHWFKLGRSLTPTGTSRALLSWSASMFEYLDAAARDARLPQHAPRRDLRSGRRPPDEVRRAARGVPWGISESAYNAQDLEGNYQYRAFGVPGLGLKRGLADDLVVAPYATILAALVSPAEAVANLEALAARGHGRPVRLLRSDRLHARPRAQGSARASCFRPTWRTTRA